jgi:hypothetical protein
MKIGFNTFKKIENHPTLVFRNLHIYIFFFTRCHSWKDLIFNPFQENQQEENVGCESLIDPTILK